MRDQIEGAARSVGQFGNRLTAPVLRVLAFWGAIALVLRLGESTGLFAVHAQVEVHPQLAAHLWGLLDHPELVVTGIGFTVTLGRSLWATVFDSGDEK